MHALGKSVILRRLSMLSVFLSYLLAGASLVLPAESRCARFAKFSATSAVRSGASCPLSYHGHHCHHGVKKTPGHITLCPDGCLHHNEQGGEIPSLAKFLSAPISGIPAWVTIGFAPEERRLYVLA